MLAKANRNTEDGLEIKNKFSEISQVGIFLTYFWSTTWNGKDKKAWVMANNGEITTAYLKDKA